MISGSEEGDELLVFSFQFSGKRGREHRTSDAEHGTLKEEKTCGPGSGREEGMGGDLLWFFKTKRGDGECWEGSVGRGRMGWEYRTPDVENGTLKGRVDS